MHTKTMHSVSPLYKLEDMSGSKRVTLQFEDRVISAPAGISVAAALLLNGASVFRTTPVTSAPRAPYCMMGVCFECLVEVDGMPSRQACQIEVREGMIVRRQLGASSVAAQQEGEGHEH